jgi:hypothetical protein
MRTVTQGVKRVGLLTALVASAVMALAATPASAAPVWRIDSLSSTTAAPESQVRYLVQVTNVGDAAMTAGAPYTVKATFPAGLTAASAVPTTFFGQIDGPCEVDSLANTITCSDSGTEVLLNSGTTSSAVARQITFTATVDPSAAGVLSPSFEVSGGGAGSVSTVDPTRISASPAPFGIDAFDSRITAADGSSFTEAGGNPYGITTWVDFNTLDNSHFFKGERYPVLPTKDVVVALPPGLLGNPTLLTQCTTGELANGSGTQVRSLCPPESQVGTVFVKFNSFGAGDDVKPVALFSMVPPAGAPARFAFNFMGTMVTLDARLRTGAEPGISIDSRNITQALGVQGTEVEFWGTPAATSHRLERGCPGEVPVRESGVTCASESDPKPFLRLPTSCPASGEGPAWSLAMDSWPNPGRFDAKGDPDLSDPAWEHTSISSHEQPGHPAEPASWGAGQGITDCAQVPVRGSLTARPTAIETETSSGLEVHVEIPSPGLSDDPEHIRTAASDIKAVKVALPEGMTINPSQAEGLGTCTAAQYESSRLEFFPDGQHGCPSDSKIGTVSVETPLLEETIPGSVYIAQPFANPFGSLLALYVVLEEPQRGVLVKLAGKVETNEKTGQITTIFNDLPQLPFSSFDFKFREGARAPLVTPQSCGTYTTTTEITGWSQPGNPITSTSDFQIVRGIGGSPCPTGGLPPFKPGLIAGSLNNTAGAYSPFNVRLFRTDAEQEFTNFSIKLPPGISAKLAGVPFCPDAAIEAAKQRSGAEEIAAPACPAASEVGRTLAGAGVGSVLAYAPGKIYLAGPYHGSALSIASVTAAKVGPFDLGTVVVRLALRVDPETAEVFVDATGSDPIPHIIDGITVHLRDIRAYVDKPEFTLNPTSCERTSTSSTLLGSGLDFFSDIDDRPVTVSTHYQAASCASLAFKPDLKLQLKGGTKRAGHPSLKATLKMKPGMANIARAQVTLPKSEFLDQSHIGTVCTRVQYAKDQCPAKSVYGYAKAITPILDEPLQGPVYLRSSSHKLPDLVAGLKSGKIEIDLAGRIDSVDGQIRSTFETVPDAPVSKFVLTMQGGKKGLLENSTNLCAKAHKAIVEFDGQNGKISDSNPVVKPQCKKAKRKKAAKRRNAR